MPINNCNYPYGIQTNIIGTGGSSVSPIVNTNGEVLGITQRSIFGHTPLVKYENMDEYYEGKIHPVENFHAMTEIGLIYGISNNFLYTSYNRSAELSQNPSFNFDIKLTVLEKISSERGKFKDDIIKCALKKIEIE